MATWVLTGTGLPLSASGSDLSGSVPLSGAQPADFDPQAVTEVRVIRTITVSGLTDDTVNVSTGVEVANSSGQSVATTLGNSTSETADGSFPATIPMTPGGLFFLDPTGNVVRESNVRGWWAQYVSNMKNDQATVSLTAVTVEVDYTPGAAPAASFTKDKATVYTGQSIQFTDTSSGSPNQWSWDFGGGASSSTQQNPLVTFNTPGVYDVRLTATNAFGSNQSAPQQVTVLAREAEVWNGSAWVGGESWNGVAWVTPEVWDGTQWVPMKAP